MTSIPPSLNIPKKNVDFYAPQLVSKLMHAGMPREQAEAIAQGVQQNKIENDLPKWLELERWGATLTTAVSGTSGVPILVAASNAPSVERSAAAFKCDGIHDEVEISNALNTAQGGVVQLSTGTFTIGANISTTSNSYALQGRGPGATTIKQANGTNWQGNPFIPLNGSGSAIRDLTFDYNVVNNGTANAPVFSVGSNSSGVFWQRVNVKNTGSAGAFLIPNTTINADHLFLEDCVMTLASGVWLDGIFGSVRLIFVSGCDLTVTNGYLFHNCAPVYIVNSTLVLEAFTSIDASNGGAIVGCSISSTSNVVATFTNSGAIIGNTFQNTGGATATSGARAVNAAGDAIVANNVIRGYSTGINYAGGVTGTGVIANNMIRGAMGDGITINQAATTTCTVSGNEIADAGQTTTNTYAGIHISGTGSSGHVEIVGNRIRQTPGVTNRVAYGVRIDAGVTDTLVWSNDMAGAYATAAVLDSGTGTRFAPDPTPPGGIPSGPAGGDLAGTYPNPTVDGWQGKPLSGTLPSANGQIYVYDATGGGWNPHAIGGDLSALTNTGVATVQKIQGTGVSATAPTDAQLFVYNGTSTLWVPVSLSGHATVTNAGVVTVSGSGIDTTAIHSGAAAGGELAGTYPNPTIAARTAPIVDQKVFCKAIQTTVQLIPGSTFTAVTLDGADVDDALNMHDPTTNNTRITVPYTGMYMVTGNVWQNATAGGSLREAAIRVNGTTLVWENRQTNAQNATAQPSVLVSGPVFLNSGDYVELMAFHDVAGGLNTLIVAARGPFLAASLLQRTA